MSIKEERLKLIKQNIKCDTENKRIFHNLLTETNKLSDSEIEDDNYLDLDEIMMRAFTFLNNEIKMEKVNTFYISCVYNHDPLTYPSWFKKQTSKNMDFDTLGVLKTYENYMQIASTAFVSCIRDFYECVENMEDDELEEVFGYYVNLPSEEEFIEKVMDYYQKNNLEEKEISQEDIDECLVEILG